MSEKIKSNTETDTKFEQAPSPDVLGAGVVTRLNEEVQGVAGTSEDIKQMRHSANLAEIAFLTTMQVDNMLEDSKEANKSSDTAIARSLESAIENSRKIEHERGIRDVNFLTSLFADFPRQATVERKYHRWDGSPIPIRKTYTESVPQGFESESLEDIAILASTVVWVGDEPMLMLGSRQYSSPDSEADLLMVAMPDDRYGKGCRLVVKSVPGYVVGELERLQIERLLKPMNEEDASELYDKQKNKFTWKQDSPNAISLSRTRIKVGGASLPRKSIGEIKQWVLSPRWKPEDFEWTEWTSLETNLAYLAEMYGKEEEFSRKLQDYFERQPKDPLDELTQ